MKLITIICMFFVLLLKSEVQAADGRNLQVAGSAKRVALVIGNDRYKYVTELQNAAGDARSMAVALERAGFTVTFKENADLATMKQSVRQFKSSLSGGDEAIFFYSGHGVQLGAANYLLPVDITSDNEDQVRDDAIPLQRLLDDFQEQKVKFALAIIDACRDNPFKGNGRSIAGTRGLAPTSAANGEMVIFSAGAGQQALDKLGNADRDENGVFTRVFLQEMEKPGVEVHQVLRNVRSRVVKMAKSVNHNQMPALYDQVEGDFYFYAGNANQVAGLVPVPVQQLTHIKTNDEIEDEYWGAIKDSSDPRGFEQYHKVYPKGRYLKLANLKIEQFRNPIQVMAPNNPPVIARADAETDLWNAAQKGNTRESYQRYISNYPNGRYSAQAKLIVMKLDVDAARQSKLEREAQQLSQQEAERLKDQTKNTQNSGGIDRSGSEENLVWNMPTQGKLIKVFSEAENSRGIDIAGKLGQPVFASAPGKVVYCDSKLHGYGKLIIIKHNATYLSAYAHNDQILVKEGESVTRGQKIAEMGNTESDQVKLYFEIRRQGKPVDPAEYLSL
ncbi:MAG: caspase family protein [Gallionella sp.]|jgi:murein DD-endopeptidase MepM/ murein hydrolase activator NlpD